MAVKRLSSPFPTAIFPEPDGAIDAFDRALLAVGYPLEASVPSAVVPPVTPEVVTRRVPSFIPAPMVYRDILLIEMEPWWYIGAETWGKFVKAMAYASRLYNSCFDFQKAKDALCASARINSRTLEIFKAKEAFNAISIVETDAPDRLKFGMIRKVLISQADKLLGID